MLPEKVNVLLRKFQVSLSGKTVSIHTNIHSTVYTVLLNGNVFDKVLAEPAGKVAVPSFLVFGLQIFVNDRETAVVWISQAVVKIDGLRPNVDGDQDPMTREVDGYHDEIERKNIELAGPTEI